MSCSSARGSEGFTLLEVLVALVIVAVALGACLRATGMLADSSAGMRERTLAQWSATNHLARMRLTGVLPPPGLQRTQCSQGRIALVCEDTVITLENPAFHLVVVSVYRADEGIDTRVRLAQVATVLTAPTSPAL
ncbi:type II secretion system minor pseudopilin GspI [Ralstonia sp.]|uniref:type II secretion system minor pseudopilin GspI n=1 Tax=Ralstonia sp. TaxID=54061 RepID=UPI0031D01BF5